MCIKEKFFNSLQLYTTRKKDGVKYLRVKFLPCQLQVSCQCVTNFYPVNSRYPVSVSQGYDTNTLLLQKTFIHSSVLEITGHTDGLDTTCLWVRLTIV